jgi:hypothetical protein
MEGGSPVYSLKDPTKIVGIHIGYDNKKCLHFATMITK